jgi:hypothetical protein
MHRKCPAIRENVISWDYRFQELFAASGILTIYCLWQRLKVIFSYLIISPSKSSAFLSDLVETSSALWQIKVYKYKVVSTSFNDDIYGIEIIFLKERLHVLVNILAMGSFVWWCCHQLTIIIYGIGSRAITAKGLLRWMSSVIYSKIST